MVSHPHGLSQHLNGFQLDTGLSVPGVDKQLLHVFSRTGSWEGQTRGSYRSFMWWQTVTPVFCDN
jgi:hypothetical protein